MCVSQEKKTKINTVAPHTHTHTSPLVRAGIMHESACHVFSPPSPRFSPSPLCSPLWHIRICGTRVWFSFFLWVSLLLFFLCARCYIPATPPLRGGAPRPLANPQSVRCNVYLVSSGAPPPPLCHAPSSTRLLASDPNFLVTRRPSAPTFPPEPNQLTPSFIMIKHDKEIMCLCPPPPTLLPPPLHPLLFLHSV